MSLSSLIRKRDTGNLATAIPAISATQPKGEAATVARIATVAVATPKEEKTAPPALDADLHRRILEMARRWGYSSDELAIALRDAAANPAGWWLTVTSDETCNWSLS